MSLVMPIVAALLGLATGAGVVYLLLRGSKGTAATAAARPTRLEDASSDAAHLQLVEAIISVRDMLDPTTVVARRIGAALSTSGVVELAPAGERFDPDQHHAVLTTPTVDLDEDGCIAEVQRIGYVLGQRVIRAPEVVVYQLGSSR